MGGESGFKAAPGMGQASTRLITNLFSGRSVKSFSFHLVGVFWYFKLAFCKFYLLLLVLMQVPLIAVGFLQVSLISLGSREFH